MSDQPGRSTIDPKTSQLAERYGIDPSRLQEIVDRVGTEQPVAPAVQPAEDPVRVEAVGSGANLRAEPNVRSAGSDLNELKRKRDRDAVSQREYTTKGNSAWLIALLLIASIAALIFASRGCDRGEAPPPPATTSTETGPDVPPVDTLLTQQADMPADTAVTGLTSGTGNAPAAPASSRPRSSRRTSRAGSSNRNVVMSTTSSFSAQESLAELRANGEASAYIETITRKGTTVYRVKRRR